MTAKQSGFAVDRAAAFLGWTAAVCNFNMTSYIAALHSAYA